MHLSAKWYVAREVSKYNFKKVENSSDIETNIPDSIWTLDLVKLRLSIAVVH